jgi:hypothetical protein
MKFSAAIVNNNAIYRVEVGVKCEGISRPQSSHQRLPLSPHLITKNKSNSLAYIVLDNCWRQRKQILTPPHDLDNLFSFRDDCLLLEVSTLRTFLSSKIKSNKRISRELLSC